MHNEMINMTKETQDSWTTRMGHIRLPKVQIYISVLLIVVFNYIHITLYEKYFFNWKTWKNLSNNTILVVLYCYKLALLTTLCMLGHVSRGRF